MESINKIDILLKNGYVLTMDEKERELAKGWVAIKDNLIYDIGSIDQACNFEASEVIDANGGIIMPGLINAHTHVAMTLFRGLADDLPLMNWLHEYIFPAESRLCYDHVYKGSLLGCAEMIMSGTTTFCDMYLFEDAVAEAAKKAKMRALVGEVLFDFPSPNYGEIEKGFLYTESLFEKWKNDPLISIAVEPHSPYLCSIDLLKKANAIAEKYQAPLVIHVSETNTELEQMMKKYQKTSVEHLADIGLLSPKLIADHCVVLSNHDIELLEKFDVKVVHNPESNMKLASGIARIPELIKRCVCVALGTDGCASNNNLDLFQEMDTAAKLHKVNKLDPTVMDAKTVLKMATIEGAKALGLESHIGSLEKGKKADIIIIDTHKPHLTPMYHPSSHIVYAARGNDVTTVIINGEIILKDRTFHHLDIEEIITDVNKISHDISNY